MSRKQLTSVALAVIAAAVGWLFKEVVDHGRELAVHGRTLAVIEDQNIYLDEDIESLEKIPPWVLHELNVLRNRVDLPLIPPPNFN